MIRQATINNIQELRSFLRDKPLGWGVTVAARIGLRVLPLTLIDGEADAANLTLQAFRALFTTWAQMYSRHRQSFLASYLQAAGEAALNAADHFGTSDAASNAARAAGYAALAAAAGSAAVENAAKAAQFAAIAAADVTDDEAADLIWQSIVADLQWLSKSKTDGDLIRQPVWLMDVRGTTQFQANFPLWVRKPFDAFDKSYRATSGPWGVCLAWYRAILPNSFNANPQSSCGEDADIKIATRPAKFWERGPDRVMAIIAEFSRRGIRRQQVHSYLKPQEDSSTISKKTARARRRAKAGATRPSDQRDSKRLLSKRENAPPENVETHSDEPTSQDQLNRRPFAQALVERMDKVHAQGGRDGFAIHLHGPWGAGKTSLVMMMSEFMTSENRGVPDRWAVVYFNAWQHERRNPPWWPLMEAVKADCAASLWRRKLRCRAIRLHARWLWWKVIADFFPIFLAIVGLAVIIYLLWFSGDTSPSQTAVPAAANQTLSVPAANAPHVTASRPNSTIGHLFEIVGGNVVKGLATIATVFVTFIAAGRAIVFGSSNSAKFYFDLAQDPLSRITHLFKRIVGATKVPICIFIDDLDRCCADYVVDLLEGIQTSFRDKNVAYVVAADRAWIRSSFEARYNAFSHTVGDLGQPLGYLFLEKIFQVSVPVPGMGDSMRKVYWNELLTGAAATANSRQSSERAAVGNDLPKKEALDDVKKAFDSSVRIKRESLRAEHGENLTSKQAEAALQASDTAVDRAAVLLELNTSRTAEKEVEHLLAKFTDIVPDNPRVMKRMVNAFAMRRAVGIVENSGTPIEVLARWTILEQRFPVLADLLIEHPDWAKIVADGVKARDRGMVPTALLPFVDSEVVRDVVGRSASDRLTIERIRSITKGSAT